MCFFGQNKLNLERGKETLHFIFQGNVYHSEGLMNSQTHQDFFFFFLATHPFQVDPPLPRVLCGQAAAL